MLSAANLRTPSMKQRDLLLSLFSAGIAAADPKNCVPRLLPPPPTGRTVVIAAGKAAASMARAVEDNWQGDLSGIAVTRYEHGLDCRRIDVIEAAHPVPDNRGEEAALKIMETVRGLGEDDLLLCLISGGGSALLGLPADGLSLDEKKAINKALLKSGAPIDEMNTVRKHLSAIKGGRLAAAAYPARVITIGISDVPGDDPSVIASGPTVPDTTTRKDALEILDRYGIDVPAHVSDLLGRETSETPKPGDPIFENTAFYMATRPIDMVHSVVSQASDLGLDVVSLGADIEGEAREIGAQHARLAVEKASQMRPGDKPMLIVSGGETTVTVGSDGGRGGRNCEYLLSLAVELDAHPQITALAGDTDGIDGSEANAGAICDPTTLARAASAGMDPIQYLERNDSWTLFNGLEDLVTSGPTRTNVNDLRLIYIQNH